MSATQHTPILAREGWPHIAIVVALALLVHFGVGGLWATPAWLLVLFVVQFFRDPAREIPQQPGAVVSPADGKVIFVGAADDPYLNRPATKISIFMNVFNVHSNRAPVAAEMKERWYHRGRFFNAALDKASAENERNALWLRTAAGDDVVCVQVAGLVARRILCYPKVGEHLERGERYGFIRFGSRLDVYLPPDAQLNVGLGDKPKAGRDIIAYLPVPADVQS